jgi:hypothetical protein
MTKIHNKFSLIIWAHFVVLLKSDSDFQKLASEAGLLNYRSSIAGPFIWAKFYTNVVMNFTIFCCSP